jgi:atrial natriuretic peptide receptor A
MVHKVHIYILFILGITGNVSIDANGDRNADYSLLDMDPETGEFEVKS